MEGKKVNLKDFNKRSDLERAVLGSEDKIIGTEEEMKRFQLSDKTKVNGVICEVSDKKVISVLSSPRPERGEIKNYKLK